MNKRYIIVCLMFPLIAAFTGPEGPTDRGSAAYAKGEYDKAADEYRSALEDDPDKAEPHFNMGDALYKEGDFEGALKEYEQAAKIDPKMSDAAYNMGNALYRLGRYDDALKAYQRAGSQKGADKDIKHNIKVTMARVKKEKEQQQQPNSPKPQQPEGKKPGQGTKGQGQGNSGQGQSAGQKGASGPSAGTPPLSNEELQSLLDRQAKEEKGLRNYFRPGEKRGPEGREAEIEQMLRGFGMGGMAQRPARPGEPYVERDW